MLKKLTFYTFIITFFNLYNSLSAQIIPINVESQTFYCPGIPKDTLNKIFIRGRVTRQGDPKNYIAKANVQITSTYHSVSTDSLGYYWLDISEMSDATKNYIIQCSFINHQSVEKIIDHKIERTSVVNFELVFNGGIVFDETTEVKPVKKKRWWHK